jgi:hypothetical protein
MPHYSVGSFVRPWWGIKLFRIILPSKSLAEPKLLKT